MKALTILTGIVGLLLCTSLPVHASTDPKTAETLVKQTTKEVFDAVRKQRAEIDKDPSVLYGIVNQIVLPHFDFRRMSRRVLGRYWLRATPEQQASFTKQFATLLVRTYATAIRDYTDQPIRYLPLRADEGGDDVTVRTEVTSPGGQVIPISYDMFAEAGDWKVYDVSIDGVSLVINYRVSFANQIRASGMQGLIKRLEEKNATTAK